MKSIEKRKANKANAGFTLVEAVISVAMITLIGGVAMNFISSGLNIQERTLEQQEMLSTTSFVVEYMGRAIRQGDQYEMLGGGNGLEFVDKEGVLRTFSRDETAEGRGRIVENGSVLTPSSMDVTVFQVSVHDDRQPRVTIFMEAEGVREGQHARIQTTISQRRLHVE